MKYLLISLAVVFLSMTTLAQTLTITPETTYHGATRSTSFQEDWPEDKGGLLYLFVKNDGGAAETIEHVVLNGVDSASDPNVKWWRAWPETLAPGVCGWVAVKGIGGPLEQGKEVAVELKTTAGITATTTAKCVTPDLRLGNVLPSRDGRTLLVYVRNDASETIHLSKLIVNELKHDIGSDTALTLVGAQDLAPGGLAILKLGVPMALPPLAPLAVRVCGERGGAPVYVGAGLRLTEPGFAVGSWSSDLPKDAEGMAYARTLGIDRIVTGQKWALNAKMSEQYFIRTMISANSGETKVPDVALVTEQHANPDIAAWMVRDEPDLNNKPSPLMLEHTRIYQRADADTPAYLNLAISAGFNEFGNIPDITCMDHYAMFAPNAIPWTGTTRSAQMEEAIQYTDLLKQNTEPQRMWTWAQLASSVWGRQPHPWGVAYQFWAHVMGGAKGILWFKYGPGFENKYTPQIQVGQRLMKQFEPVRNLCFYGEPLKNLSAGSPGIAGRTLNGEDAVVAVVLNANIETGGVPMYTRYTLKPVQATISVPVPAWVPVEQVLQIKPDAVAPVNYTTAAGVVSFDVALDEDMGVFIIGKNDTAAPGPVSGLNVPLRQDKLVVLSWKAAEDNYGVRGYTLYRGDEKVTDVYEPIALLRNAEAQPGDYTVEPFDAANNRGPRSEAVAVR